MSLHVVPVTLKVASAYINALHRHHDASRGHKFSIGVKQDDHLVGVAMVGRPVARGFNPERVVEVTRLCTDGTPNACSILYGAAARVAKEMGYEKIVTYILASEPGTSLRAAGWVLEARVEAREWNCKSRPRSTPNLGEKTRWARILRLPCEARAVPIRRAA